MRRFRVLSCWTASFFLVHAAAMADGDPGDKDSVCLLNERKVSIAKNGLKTVTEHKIVKILKPSAVETQGDIEFEYNAHYSKAKLVLARTKTPDGRTVDVSRDSVHDTLPASFQEFKMYTDIRTLSFSMPAVQVGSILEYEIIVTDKLSVMPGHAWDSCELDDWVLVEKATYELEFPTKLNVKVHPANIETNAVITVQKGGTTRVSVTMTNIPALKFEAGMPPVSSIRRTIVVSSVPSWEEIGRWFGELAANKAKATPEMQALADELTKGKTTTVERVQAISMMVQKDVRYVGVELGRSAYEPHPAADCFRNRYGDCKDQAILLVSLLKCAGIEAVPALVRPEYFGPLVSAAPHPGQFNHAIVHVPDGNLWLDTTTKYYAATDFPGYLDNIDALLVDGAKVTMKRIQPLPASRDSERTVYDVQVGHDGKCRIRETSEFFGRAGAEMRVMAGNEDREKRRKEVEENFSRTQGAQRLIDMGHSDPHDVDQPYVNWTLYDSYTFLARSKQGFSLNLSARAVQHPLQLGWDPGEQFVDEKDARTLPWRSTSESRSEVTCRLALPRGFTIADQPENQEYQFPHGSLVMKTTAASNVVEVSCRATRQCATIGPDQWAKARNMTAATLAKAGVTIVLEDEIERMLSRGRATRAIRQVEEWQKIAPDDASLWQRAGSLHHRLGLLGKARDAYARSIEMGNRNLGLFTSLAETYGGYAGTYSHGFDRAAAVGVMKRAVAQCDDTTEARYKMALVCQVDGEGRLRGKKANFEEAIGIYNDIIRDNPKSARPHVEKGNTYLEMGDYKQAEASFSRAFELDRGNADAQVGKWICEAFLGRPEQCFNAIRNYTDDQQAQVQELVRVAIMLMTRRHYRESASLLNFAVPLSSNAEVTRDLAKMLRGLSEHTPVNYEKFFDLSTPRNALLSLMAGCYYKDNDRIRRAFSTRIRLSQTDMEALAAEFTALTAKTGNDIGDLTLDVLAWGCTATEKKLPGEHVDLRMVPPKERFFAATAGQMSIRCLVHNEQNEWRICGIGPDGSMAPMLIVAAAQCIDSNDMDSARFYVDQAVASRARGASAEKEGSSLLDEIESESFTNDMTRVFAVVGATLAGEGENADRAVDYARRAVAAEGDNLVLFRVLGHALAAAERRTEAEVVLKQVLKKKPNDWKSLGLLVKVVCDLERYDEAVEMLKALREAAPSRRQVAMTEIMILQEAGRFQEAYAAFEKERHYLPEQILPALEAPLFGKLNRKADIARLLSEQSAADVERGTMARAFGEAYMLIGDAEAGLEQSLRVLQTNPSLVQSMLMVGMQLLHTGDLRESSLMTRRVMKAPLLAQNEKMTIGELIMAQGEYKEAADWMDAIGYLDHGREVYRDLFAGICHVMLGNKDAAKNQFGKAAAAMHDPVWPKPVVEFIEGRMVFEDVLKTAEACPNTVKRGQYLCEAHYYAGMLELAAQHTDKGLELLRKAVETNSLLTSEHGLALAEIARRAKPVPPVTPK